MHHVKSLLIVFRRLFYFDSYLYCSMMKGKILRLILAGLLTVPGIVRTQNTVGLISYDSDRSYPGYNLVFPHGQGTVWLLNGCGEVVHQWDDPSNRVPGNSAYLQTNGDLLVCYNRPGSNTDPIWAGGAGQYVEMRTWDNDVLWAFELNDSLRRLHHDVVRIPNGNVLMIAWENKTPEEAITHGRDPELITEGAIWPDYILEYNPEIDSIVWEWHAWDHLIQEFDSTRLNFGRVADHPEKIHLNHIYASGQADWMHANAIAYHPDLDLIMLSVPHFDELWFIDHSTTHEEAKGDTGGYWGKGGDLIYRWGNPRAYHRGDSADQQLFFIHDVHWVEDFISDDYPYFGSVAVFNNRFAADYSAAHMFTPVADTINLRFEMIGEVWGPETYDVTVLHPVSPQMMYSSGLSSFQVLPNENYLLLNGRTGYAFEMTPENEIVWEYIVPIKNGTFISQGETAQNNLTFRIKRYPEWYSAFEGKDLTPKGFMELNPDTTYCEQLISGSQPQPPAAELRVYPNPVDAQLVIERSVEEWVRYQLIDFTGTCVMKGSVSGRTSYIDTDLLPRGMYVLQIPGYPAVTFVKQDF